MGWDEFGGGPGTDLDGLVYYGGFGMSIGGLRWVRKAWGWCGGPRVGVKGHGIVWVWRVSDVWEWVDMGMKGLLVGDGVLELIWKV